LNEQWDIVPVADMLQYLKGFPTGQFYIVSDTFKNNKLGWKREVIGCDTSSPEGFMKMQIYEKGNIA